MEYTHVPVMLKEGIEYLNLKPGQIIVDCTLGGTGYTREIAKLVGEKGKVIAIDADKMAIENAKLQIARDKLKNIILVHDNFRNLQKILEKNEVEKNISGIIFDLGLSSAQLEDRNRGFSFRVDAPLNMQFASSKFQVTNNTNKTQEIVNFWSEKDLEKIIRDYGEEKYAGRIANAIVKNRPLRTTKELVDAIMNAVPASYRRGKIHSATRTFQALRIATNDELKALEEVLPQALKALKFNGRLVVVSYHSLEDRIVKNFFRREAKECICPPENMVCTCGHKPLIKILTKKPITPSEEEINLNIRARSAKLRAAEKITHNT